MLRMNNPILWISIGAILAAVGSASFVYASYLFSIKKQAPEPYELSPEVKILPDELNPQPGRMNIQIGITNKSEYMAKNVAVFPKIMDIDGKLNGSWHAGFSFFEYGKGQFYAERIYPTVEHVWKKILFDGLKRLVLQIDVVAEDVKINRWITMIAKEDDRYRVHTNMHNNHNIQRITKIPPISGQEP